MKYLLSISSILLIVLSANIGFSQNMSEKEWKKRVAGKTLTGNGLYMTLNKNGTINGTATKDGQVVQMRGTWTYTKSRGYCRKMTIILSNGKIIEEGEACQKFVFLGNGKVEAYGGIYTLK